MAPLITGRALHWVFKVADRTATIRFYREVLGMKVLRHEEFSEGCAASCNGPYDGKWSKTMVGYGDEDTHFVVELTYNYGIKSYKLGNDFAGITIKSAAAIERAKAAGIAQAAPGDGEGAVAVQAPDGYPFILLPGDVAPGADPVQSLRLNVTDIEKSLSYWRDLVGMSMLTESTEPTKSAALSFGADQASLELCQLPAGAMLAHEEAFGRVAFACPSSELRPAESAVKETGHTILTPFVSLDTPGKATVQVVILGDPDGYEICFVNDEGFRDLSKVDPEADRLLDEAVAADDSVAWFAKKAEKAAAREAVAVAAAE